MRKRSRFLAYSAIIAALYAVLCHFQNLLLPGSASWAIQMRAAEALCVLAFFTPAAIPGLGIGCLLFNLSFAGALPLGSVICPKELCSNAIVRYVRAMENQTGAAVSVHTIADGQVEAMEFLLDENTLHCGVPLKEIRLQPNVLLVSISHCASSEIPYGDSRFHPGDIVVVVTNGREIIRQFNDIFA